MSVIRVFTCCVEAITRGELIHRESVKDKEFHFQNWFKTRMEQTGIRFEQGGRNSYPDFRMVATTEGYEIKDSAYPGRDANFDSNSQAPSGFHNGRTIYYVFGRYPKEPDGDSYPVFGLVMCHGDFLNADHEYVHENKSVKGFGSYGDILIRDRKMYVVPTPFRLVEGLAHHQTLILPANRRQENTSCLSETSGAPRRPKWFWDIRSICEQTDSRRRKCRTLEQGRIIPFAHGGCENRKPTPFPCRGWLRPRLAVVPTMRNRMSSVRLIETDRFPFEFISELAERESWRKEVHRPIYHVHKWWAKRLGSVFRGILLGCTLSDDHDLQREFYHTHTLSGTTVFDPFMGSGTTVGEAHKLGLTALGRDINPVAVDAVRVALGPLRRDELQGAFEDLSEGIGRRLGALYRSKDSLGRACDVLYYFWVMRAPCPQCCQDVDLFPSFIIAANAYPNRKPTVQVLCPACNCVFPGRHGKEHATCISCGNTFMPDRGTAHGAKATCPRCKRGFRILDALGGERPRFRQYAKLVLTQERLKEYLPTVAEDDQAYAGCSQLLESEVRQGSITLPVLRLADGYNTRQAMRYGFASWRDFFNDRQLLALGWLHAAIAKLDDAETRAAFLTLFSGVLEFNNMFASYKGEGTGAVRHMFSHHILKPERTPVEANVWGTAKSSGAFSNLFRSRLVRAIEYRKAPTEVNGRTGRGVVCAPAFSGRVDPWPRQGPLGPRAIYLSCGDSATTGLPDGTIDLVVTDPPFFDNVHYSELADFFYSWQQIVHGERCRTTRSPSEVQDTVAGAFAEKLKAVLRECHRVLKADGLLVFTYHHSRDEGWEALTDAVLGAGFMVANSHPVKAEMSVATPKSQAKEPIQFDIILACRKAAAAVEPPPAQTALLTARAKLQRLQACGFHLSRNDRKIVLYGQLLSSVAHPADIARLAPLVNQELERTSDTTPTEPKDTVQQLQLF